MMLSIYGEAEQVKQARLAREEAERQRREQERRREEQCQRYNAEVDRTLALVNCAEDYEIACRIRAYVSAMEKIKIFLHGRLGCGQKQIGMIPRSQKKTNFLAGENTKRVKSTKGLNTRDTGGKAEVCSPPDLDRIVVRLSILAIHYYKYSLNNY